MTLVAVTIARGKKLTLVPPSQPGDNRALMSRFACSSKNCDFSSVAKIVGLTIFCGARDFSLFFVMLIITKPERVADLTKFATSSKP